MCYAKQTHFSLTIPPHGTCIPVFYSVRNDFTGLASAALSDW